MEHGVKRKVQSFKFKNAPEISQKLGTLNLIELPAARCQLPAACSKLATDY